MPVTVSPSTSAVLCLVAAVLLYVLRRTASRNDLPPGPPRLPLLGNVLRLPKRDQHLTFMEWTTRYGDVVYAQFFTQPVVILGSATAAIDLLEKRSARYSNRQRFVYFEEMIGWTGNVGFNQYNERWKRIRRWYQQRLVAKSSAINYHPLQYRQVRRLLHGILQNPEDYAYQLKRHAAGILFEVSYGDTVMSLSDHQVIRSTEDSIRDCLVGSSFGSALVDFCPIMQHLPAWMPGMSFKYITEKARRAIVQMESLPYNAVKNAIEDGTAKPSLTTDLIRECSTKGELSAKDERDIMGAAGALYSGGADTSLTTMIVFILVMVQHPAIFRTAQEEITRVVGDSRLPDFGDRESLPYLECIIREVYRWCPGLTTGVPHQAAEDDIYRGYFIPKGSTVIANLWAIFRDPNMYPEPNVFRPERFLDADRDDTFDLKDPKKLVFGFGRRICPGRYFADDTVWLAAACIIATMDIGKARDEHGKEILPTPKFISGAVMRPEPFVCDIQPRSERSRRLILDSAAEVWAI